MLLSEGSCKINRNVTIIDNDILLLSLSNVDSNGDKLSVINALRTTLVDNLLLHLQLLQLLYQLLLLQQLKTLGLLVL